MKKKVYMLVTLLVGFSVLLAACAPAATEAPAAAGNPGLQMESAKVAEQFYNDADFAKSKEFNEHHRATRDAQSICNTGRFSTDISKYPQYKSFARQGPPSASSAFPTLASIILACDGYVTMREQVEMLR
jgi:hypothetical protein